MVSPSALFAHCDTKGTIMKLKRTILAVLAGAAGLASVPAFADDGWHHGWERHHGHHYYYAPPVVYAPAPRIYYPSGVYYTPPPVVYQPAPVYYPAPVYRPAPQPGVS